MTSGKIAILGAGGQLGSDVAAVFRDRDVVPVTRADLDITDTSAVDEFFDQTLPSVAINTAAFNHTTACERMPEQAFAVNAIGAWSVARACDRVGSLLVHVSTDYVFDGEKNEPYVETDETSPLNVYGLSKLAGEYAVSSYCPDSYVVRTCGLYGVQPSRAKGGNFVTMIRSLAAEKGDVAVVDDEIVTPTWTGSLARQLRRLCDERPVPFGIVHASDTGACSWFEFADAIFEITGTDVTLRRTKVADYPSEIRRPRYSVLDNAALEKAGANVMADWRASLTEYLKLVEP